MNAITTAATATRNPAWYRLGATVDADTMDAAAALDQAGMAGWNVRKQPLFTETEDGQRLEVPNRVATVRDDPATGTTRYLGYVGHNYVIQQNEETFDFLDSVVDVAGAHYDSAGYMKDGARIFTTLKMPEGIKIAGQDAHDLYLLATNGHDGFNAFTVAVVPIRLMCTNQLTMALRNARQSWKIRHTTHMAGRIAEARESLAMTFEYMDAFTAEMEMLLDQSYTEAMFDRLTRDLLPDAKTDATQQRVDARRDELMRLFVEADTNEFGRGTRYGALNAVTEFADWSNPIRGDHDGTRHALRLMDGGTVQTFKDTAHRLLVNA